MSKTNRKGHKEDILMKESLHLKAVIEASYSGKAQTQTKIDATYQDTLLKVKTPLK